MNYNHYGVNTNYTASLIDFTDEAMQNFCNPILNGTQKVFSLTLYLNTKDQIINLNTNNVNGISVFVLENGSVKHKLFIKDNTGYIERKDFAIEANLVSSSNLGFILFCILPSNLETQSCVFIKNETLMGSTKLKSNKDGFMLKKAIYGMNWYKANKKDLLNKKNMYAKAPNGGGTNNNSCGPEPGCGNGLPWDACEYNPFTESYGCGGSVCIQTNTQSLIVNNNALSPSDILTDFNFTLCYSFRDSFLRPSYLGYKYADYYYAIGQVAGSSFSLTTALKMANALPTMYIAINKLMNPSGYEGDILVTTEYATDLHSIIDDFKTLSTDSDYQAILADLESDLDY